MGRCHWTSRSCSWSSGTTACEAGSQKHCSTAGVQLLLIKDNQPCHHSTHQSPTRTLPLPPCRALGCLDPQCALCQYNPNRRCHVNFDRKYLVNDILKAKCAANIRVELIDRITGQVYEDDVSDIKVEVRPQD